MNTKQFIKVTTKSGKSFVIPMQNKQYYLSQGATITEPTKEEVLATFPELAKSNKTQDSAKRIAELEAALAERDKTIEELKAQIEQQNSPSDDAEADANADTGAEAPAEAKKTTKRRSK